MEEDLHESRGPEGKLNGVQSFSLLELNKACNTTDGGKEGVYIAGIIPSTTQKGLKK